MITGAQIAAKASELLTMGHIPYVNGGESVRGMDCQGLVRWVMKECGLALPPKKGTNYMWRAALVEKGTIAECVRRWGKVPLGTLIFIRDYDGGEKERGYNDDEGNVWHVYIKIAEGLLIHASNGNGYVLTRDFDDKEIKNGGPNTYGMLPSTVYTGLRTPEDAAVAEDEYEEPQYGEDAAEDGGMPEGVEPPKGMEPPKVAGPGEAMINVQEGELRLRKEPKEGAKVIKGMPKGHIVKVLDFHGAWTKVEYVDFRGTVHRGWCMTEYLLLG